MQESKAAPPSLGWSADSMRLFGVEGGGLQICAKQLKDSPADLQPWRFHTRSSKEGETTPNHLRRGDFTTKMGEDIIKAPVHQLSRTVQQTAANLDYFLCQLAPNDRGDKIKKKKQPPF